MDNIVCERFAERGEFKPALDEQGDSVAGTFTTTVEFRFDDNLPELPVSAEFTHVMIVDETGLVVDCEIVGDLPDKQDGDGCPLGMRFMPATDITGKPVKVRIRTRVLIEREAVVD